MLNILNKIIIVFKFRGKLLKNKIISVIVNIALCAVIATVCAVGFIGGDAAPVTSDGENLYYRSEKARGVSLMFNVYQNTDNVYKIMDILDEYSAKATFFLGGSWADDNIDCVRVIAARGHEVGSHGYFHKDHSKMNVTRRTCGYLGENFWNVGKTREIDLRAKAFLEKYAKKYEIIDAADCGLETIDENCVDYFNAALFYEMSVLYRTAIQNKTGHPLDMRRYMGVVEY